MAKGLNWSKTEVPKNFENLNGQGPNRWSKTKFLRETLKRWWFSQKPDRDEQSSLTQELSKILGI